MPQKDERTGSGFWAFWSSLPGILTGIAAVIAAAGTLAALFAGGDGTEASAPGATAGAEPTFAPGPGDDACFGRYFSGIPRDRVGAVEAGARAYDVIQENQSKKGMIGMTFTNNGRPIGAIRFQFFRDNALFKIESIVNARCAPTEEYENIIGGDKHAIEDNGTVRIRLGGGFYDMTVNGGGNLIRIAFLSAVP